MNFAELIIKVAAMPHEIAKRQREALERIGKVVQAEARREIGVYQPALGSELPAWDPLAETTLMGVAINGVWHPGKIDLGFAPPDNPLLRTGESRETIDYMVDGHHSVEIGSNDDKILWAELGTVNEPPRSMLERAAIMKSEQAVRIAAQGLMRALGGPVLYGPEED